MPVEKTAEAGAAGPAQKKSRRRKPKAERPAESPPPARKPAEGPATEARRQARIQPARPILKRFGEMVLSEPMLAALSEAGYEAPTPVQAGLIPKALEGRDLMGQAADRDGQDRRLRDPAPGETHRQAAAARPSPLVLVPTRELAVQVRDEFAKLIGKRKLNAVAVYGGKPIRGQIEHSAKGPRSPSALPAASSI